MVTRILITILSAGSVAMTAVFNSNKKCLRTNQSFIDFIAFIADDLRVLGSELTTLLPQKYAIKLAAVYVA